MYRIESEDDLYSIGFYDYADRNGICLTEWSENIEYALPDSYIRVEIVKDAVKDAIANAKLNSLKNCWFTAGDAGHYMVQMVEEGTKPDVVFMDPPRAGSDERFLNSLIKTAPKKVVYISCNPETLKRDLNVLVHGGYRVKKIQPVDMFPFTEHCETVVLLERK